MTTETELSSGWEPGVVESKWYPLWNERGYFKAEGLEVEISDFKGGSLALQAVVGGTADVVSGAYEHTINLQAKGQQFQAFVLQGRAPQILSLIHI